MDPIPVGLRQLHDIRATRNAGVVHQNVDPAECFQGLAHHAIDVLQIPDISLHAKAPPLQVHDGICRFIGILAADIGGDHMRARSGKCQRRRLADTLSRTGYQRHLIGQTHDVTSSRERLTLQLIGIEACLTP